MHKHKLNKALTTTMSHLQAHAHCVTSFILIWNAKQKQGSLKGP